MLTSASHFYNTDGTLKLYFCFGLNTSVLSKIRFIRHVLQTVSLISNCKLKIYVIWTTRVQKPWDGMSLI